MGGPVGGRRRARPAVGDCRALAIGELIDGGRWQTQRGGEVLWRAPHTVGAAERLSYTLRVHDEKTRANLGRLVDRAGRKRKEGEGN